MLAHRSNLLRISLAALVAVALVGAALVTRDFGSVGDGAGDDYDNGYAAKATELEAAEHTDDSTSYLPDAGHTHDPGTTPHDDADPRTKNAISRSAQVTDPGTEDPTTPAEAAENAVGAATQRSHIEPALSSVPVSAAQPTVPTDRYNLFNNCYGLQSTKTRTWLGNVAAPGFKSATIGAGTALYFKPTELGKYLLHSPAGTYLSGASGKARYVAKPGPKANWTVTRPGPGSFRLFLPGAGYLAVSTSGAATFAAAPTTRTQFKPNERAGCKRFPEVAVNVRGNPTSGVTAFQETRGYIDAHTHGMAFEFLGGQVHCGRPWSPWGVATALKDCPDHTLTGGRGALLEAFLSGEPSHDPVGWPTFKDWPAPRSLTHEGTYYKWMERSWRGGQRILVNLLVENNKLCELYPLKRNSCDDMDSIRLQAKDMRLLERYVDAQHGGPGKGWYRIVRTPDQARRVINAGKLAVVMGIETSVPFGCTQKLGIPACSKASIDRQLDEVRALGVSQMELVNKFDNALSGVAGDSGSTGYLVNSANTLETGSPWRMKTCVPNDFPADNGIHDKDQDNSAPIPDQDALFGALLHVLPGINLPAIPVYGPKHHCNSLGLTDLGVHTIQGLAERHMLFDPDHMSVKARKASLDLTAAMDYAGVLSSHSWSTPDAYPRIYDQQGFIAPYAGDSTGFVEKWKRLLTWANPEIYWGIGFGADINGLGAQGDPRAGAASNNPVTYPFTGLGGVTIHKQTSGSRVYDINKDGVAHYGLYPDWVEDLRKLAGDGIVRDLERGSEAYLQTWERAYGVTPNACTSTALRKAPGAFRSLPVGLTTWQVLTRMGQPDRRLGDRFTYCTSNGRATLTFSGTGRLTRVTAS